MLQFPPKNNSPFCSHANNLLLPLFFLETKKRAMKKEILLRLQILELESGATLNEVKKSYRDLCVIWHPDRAPARLKEKTTEKLKKINEAYNWIIKNPTSLERTQDWEEEKIIQCPNCLKNLIVPNGIGIVNFSCPHCDLDMCYDSDVHEFKESEEERLERARKKREKIKGLMLEYSLKNSGKGNLYTYPDLPWKRVENAINSYASMGKDEEPMGYLRFSGLNSGSILLTNKRIYWQHKTGVEGFSPKSFEIMDIQNIELISKGEKGLIKINSSHVIDLGFLPSGEESTFIEIVKTLQNIIAE